MIPLFPRQPLYPLVPFSPGGPRSPCQTHDGRENIYPLHIQCTSSLKHVYSVLYLQRHIATDEVWYQTLYDISYTSSSELLMLKLLNWNMKYTYWEWQHTLGLRFYLPCYLHLLEIQDDPSDHLSPKWWKQKKGCWHRKLSVRPT